MKTSIYDLRIYDHRFFSQNITTSKANYIVHYIASDDVVDVTNLSVYVESS